MFVGLPLGTEGAGCLVIKREHSLDELPQKKGSSSVRVLVNIFKDTWDGAKAGQVFLSRG